MDTSMIRSLEEVRRELSTQHKCETRLKKLRWPNGIACSKCGATRPYWLKNQRLWECRSCKYHFSVTAQTIFHRLNRPGYSGEFFT